MFVVVFVVPALLRNATRALMLELLCVDLNITRTTKDQNRTDLQVKLWDQRP